MASDIQPLTPAPPFRRDRSGYAAAWGKWFPIIEGAAKGLSARMLDRAAVAPGQRVLDVGTGIGEPALAAARRVGATGSVLGVDVSADMLAVAQDRLRRSGLGNVEFQEMDADILDLPAASFDAVLCRWSLMFAADLGKTLADLRDVVKPGGRFVAAVWGAPEDVPAISLATRVIYDALDLGAPNEGAGTAFALHDTEAFMQRCRDAGFTNAGSERVAVAYEFPSADDFVGFRTDCASWLTEQMAPFSEARQAAAWRAVTEAAKAYETDEGTVRMVNQAYCVFAERGG